MDAISISNKTKVPLCVMLEPMADRFDIEPSGLAEVVADFGPVIEIEVHEDNFVSVWVLGSVTVKIGGKEIDFPDL